MPALEEAARLLVEEPEATIVGAVVVPDSFSLRTLLALRLARLLARLAFWVRLGGVRVVIGLGNGWDCCRWKNSS